MHPSLGVLDAKDHSPIGGLIVLFGKENGGRDLDQDVAVRGKEACDLYLPRPTPHMDRLCDELAQLPDCCCRTCACATVSALNLTSNEQRREQ